MDIAQLKALAKHGESERVEFKSSTGSIASGMQTVCAFLNSDHGGIVAFGIQDDGKIIGQQVTDKTHKEIAAELQRIEPHAKIDIEYIPLTSGREVIVVGVPAGNKAPYTYDGRAYMRSQTTTMRMHKDEYMYLHNKHNPELWESLINNRCTIKDLDQKRIHEVVRRAVLEKRLPEEALTASIPELLKKLNLLVDNKVTNAAVILFCKDESKQFLQASVKLARFRGTDKSEFLDTKEVRANAFDLYDAAERYLVFALPLAASTKEGTRYRVETPTIPYSVLREALINALAHRDYSYVGGSVDVAIYDDRVEIVNNGNLPHGVTIKKLTEPHKSIPRNPLIAHVFYLCRMIERWGRGTLDMIKDCEAVGNPAPIFHEEDGVFTVTLPFKEPLHTTLKKAPQKAGNRELTDRQKKIIALLQRNPLNRQELMEQLGIELTSRGMQLELAHLRKLDLIKPVGRGRSTVWMLKT